MRELDLLPNPDQYADWKDFARALVLVLQEASRYRDQASIVAFSPEGAIAATNVQAAITELDTEKLAISGYTAADVLAKLLTVDGAGSGLDADLLDGQSGAFYLARANHTGTQTWSTITSTPTTLAGYGIADAQPLDSDLTTIAGLTATTDNFIVSVSSAWASRTPAQVRTTLALGTAAVKNTGVSGDTVPVLNGAATTWAAGATFGGFLDVASTIRATGDSTPASGAGMELYYTGGESYILSFDRSGSVYKPLNMLGSVLRVALGSLGNYVDDAAAAAGGVAVGTLYRNGSVLMVRAA